LPKQAFNLVCSLKHPVQPGVFFLEYRMMVRRYLFEIILACMIICGAIAFSFYL